RAAHPRGDPHRAVSDDHAQLAGEDAVPGAQDEVAHRRRHVLADDALQPVLDHHLAGGDPEANRGRPLPGPLRHAEVAAGAGIARAPLAPGRGARDPRDLRARAVAPGEPPPPPRRLPRRPAAPPPLRPRPGGRGAWGPWGGASAGRGRWSGWGASAPPTTRGRSMSSTRSTKRPPAARAESHATRAAAAEPRWRSPVGDGAKRPRVDQPFGASTSAAAFSACTAAGTPA